MTANDDKPIPTNLHRLREDCPPQSVTAVLEDAKADDLSCVLILGLDEDEELVVRCTHLTNKDALWLLEMGKAHALGL